MRAVYIICGTCISILFLSGCGTTGVSIQGQGYDRHGTQYHRPGPPPHAPAHGYRHKNPDGYNLVYDSRKGAYIVVNVPYTYYGNNFYLRLSSDGSWLVSTRLDGRWRLAVHGEVPNRLKSYYDNTGPRPYGKQKKKRS
jgi:hypothetical protein